MLLCTVRDCRRPLAHAKRRVLCPEGHSFDVARSGYINLLQPQDRRSKNPGDSADAVAARRRLHDLGVTQPLLDGIAGITAIASSDVVLDAGCGDGFYLGSLARLASCDAHGVDISIPAIDAAARRYPPEIDRLEWIVANADRQLPYADASFTLVMAITGRMQPAEFLRVLAPGGHVLVALPAPDDLKELRSATDAEGRDRVPRTLEEFAPHFRLAEQRRVTTTADLDAAAVQDVLVSIYRPLRATPAQAMRVTFSLDLLLFRPR